MSKTNYEPKDLARCLAVLDRIAAWDDLGAGHDPMKRFGGQDEPSSALLARQTLVAVGYRTADGRIVGPVKKGAR